MLRADELAATMAYRDQLAASRTPDDFLDTVDGVAHVFEAVAYPPARLST